MGRVLKRLRICRSEMAAFERATDGGVTEYEQARSGQKQTLHESGQFCSKVLCTVKNINVQRIFVSREVLS